MTKAMSKDKLYAAIVYVKPRPAKEYQHAFYKGRTLRGIVVARNRKEAEEKMIQNFYKDIRALVTVTRDDIKIKEMKLYDDFAFVQ